MEKQHVVTLRIKRKYFDAILSGDKRVEYRDHKDYYSRLLGRPGIKAIKLHYQGIRQALVEVKSIRLIETPLHLKTFGAHVYAIDLGNARLI